MINPDVLNKVYEYYKLSLYCITPHCLNSSQPFKMGQNRVAICYIHIKKYTNGNI